MDTQTVGRLGELAVEQELVKLGWRVGNYNASTANQKSFDLFAAKGNRRVEIRVKSYKGTPTRKSEGVQYTAKKDGSIFRDFDKTDNGDFVVIARVSLAEPAEFYVVPTSVVDDAIRWTNKQWHKHPKRDGTPRKVTTHRNIDFDGEQTERAPFRGYAKIWEQYRASWHLLENAETKP